MQNNLVTVHSISFRLKLPFDFTKASGSLKSYKNKQNQTIHKMPPCTSRIKNLRLPSGQLYITTGELIYKGCSTGIWQLYKPWRYSNNAPTQTKNLL